jgi:hypothetical protein
MNIILFLGSGVSYETELPDTKTITEELLNGDWWKHSDQNFYRGKSRNAYNKIFDITPKLQNLLRYIRDYSAEYLKDRRYSDVNYEDIFYIIKQIHDEASHESDNPAIKLFIEHLNEKFDFANNREFEEHGHSKTLSEVFWKCEDFIKCVIWNMLFTNDLPKGFDLIGELISKKELNEIDIVTLNHDLLIEKYLKNLDFDYIDGFSEPKGDICLFMPQLFDEKSSRAKLFKLHGSLDWFRHRDFIEENNTTYDLYTKIVNPDYWHCKNIEGRMLNPLQSYPLFITGTYNKQSDYTHGIVRYIHLKFFEQLNKSDIIIMSGYGWNDKGISTYLFEWIMTSQNRKIVLLHKNPESLKESKSAMWHRYDDLVKWGRLIPVRKWMSETKLDDIIDYLK